VGGISRIWIGQWDRADSEGPAASIGAAFFAEGANMCSVAEEQPQSCAGARGEGAPRFFILSTCSWAAFSSKASASRSTIFRAPVGQSPRQAPRPSQNMSFTSFALPPTIAMAPSAQAGTHWPQPSQSSSSISMMGLVFLMSVVLDRSLRSPEPLHQGRGAAGSASREPRTPIGGGASTE